MSRVHVIGAGMAGLSAATSLAARGVSVVLYEQAKFAGGRCRSYHDTTLGCRLDNGNHLLLSGNRATIAYLDRIGATDTLVGPDKPLFPFIDLVSGAAWTLRLNRGVTPWWVLRRDWRVPDTSPRDYWALRRLQRAKPDDLVADLLGDLGPLYDRLLEPLAIAALNTKPEIASAAPLAAVVAESLARGGAASMPRYPAIGLSETFVDPALAFLRAHGTEFRFGARIAGLTVSENRVTGLVGPNVDEIIEPNDRVILATPPWVTAELLPSLTVPDAFEAILNLHFRAGIDPGKAGFYGLIGGVAEWVFEKTEVVSVTISAANDRLDSDPETLAAEVWSDLRRGFGLPRTMPPYRIVRERRATFAATPAQLARRPGPITRLSNLTLAGDYTATGLPSTIEGAIRSGATAANAERASG
ncbi:hydroxysqualene dehydroxylase HpnE [Acidiphilium sp.]|uniref:hydroxysqualene dehydroxylase HpnE n=1 Tax=Acidiphilium sp. TaxID=527 RepID=UPI003D00640A